MVNVKTKPQHELNQIQPVPGRTTFRIISRMPRGESRGVITLLVPRAGTVTADGNEIKRTKAAVDKDSRARIEVELKPFARNAVKRYGRIRASIVLTYVPRGGPPITKTFPLIFGYRNDWR